MICDGDSTSISLDANVLGSSFSWTVPTPLGTVATGGSGVIGDVIVQKLVNTSQTPFTISYLVTPFGPDTTTCQGATVPFDVIVNPSPITSAITGIAWGRLVTGLHGAEQGFHVFTESHIEHAVGLIEDREFDGCGLQCFPAQVVEKAAGSSHNNMGTTLELGDLAVDRGASIDGHGA